MANELRTRDGLPFNFVDGLRIKGVDVTNWEKIFIDQGASYVGFQPVGNLVATNVQAAIAELENEKQSKSEPIANATTAVNLRPGANQGIVWDNDAFGGTQDTASITLETTSGEATKMRFKMTNDSDDNFEFTAKSADGLTSFNNAMSLNGNVILNAANYVDYAASMISDYVALRAYVGNATQVRITNDGIAGFFYYDAADAVSADNGGTVIVSANGRRWKRLYEGSVNVKWFGAKGDWNGTVGADDTASIQSAVNSTPDGVVYFPLGNYRLTSQITLSTGVSLIGYGATLSITTASSSFVYSDTAIANQCTVSGFKIKGDGVTVLNNAVFSNLSGGNLRGLTYRDLYFDSVSFGIYINQENGGNNISAKIIGCRFVNIFDNSDGVTSGRGLGVAFSGGLTVGRPPLRGLVEGCTFTNTGRHAVYISSGSNVTVSNNTFYEHRVGGTLKTYSLPALNISRCSEIIAIGNTFIGCTDTCIGIQNGSPAGECRNISIQSNVFVDNSRYSIKVGTDSPDVNGLIRNVTVQNNVIRHKSTSGTPVLIVEHCQILTVSDNHVAASDLSVSLNGLFTIYGFGTTNPSDNYFIKNNTLIMPSTGANISRAININTNICSGTQTCIVANNDITAIQPIYLAAGQTNKNLLIGRKINLSLNPTLDILSGAITVSGNRHYVGTEGAASLDDLDTINGGEDGQILVLTAKSATQVVTVKDGTGNLQLAGDHTLNSVGDVIMLMYDAGSSKWIEISRSDNA